MSLPAPYFQDESASLCECGCGAEVSKGRRFVSGHNLRDMPRTPIHAARIGEAQRRAWQTKRKRKPVGSTNLSQDGYVRVKVIPGAGQWRKLHHVIVEETIGRPLVAGEVVHHINGDRLDNDPDNLHLCADQTEHGRVHASFEQLLGELLRDGVVKFDRQTGRYTR